MVYKLFAVCGAVFALSATAFAANNGNGKCVGGKCSMKEESVANGDHPLVMEPKDTCKGTVKCVQQHRYPNGSKTEMTIETENGDRKVMMRDNGQAPVGPGDRVEVHGRNMKVNGETYMMGDSMHRTGTSNLNQHVEPKSSSSTVKSRYRR